MTVTSPRPALSAAQARAVRIYGGLLGLYPRPFRQRFGDDMRQVFADLLVHHAGERHHRIWPRVLRDLAASAGRERAAQLGRAGGGRAATFVAATAAVALLLTGGPASEILVALALLIALPTLAAVELWNAWLTRRTTGAVAAGRLAIAVAAVVPTVVWLTLIGDDRGYWIVASIVLSLVCGFGLAAVWALTILAGRSRRSDRRARRSAAAALGLAAVVLGGMALAGYHSYLKSQPPPGDHSPAHASAESRALWDAARAGDLATVEAMIDACADPFVHFDRGGRARSNAEEESAGWGNRRHWEAGGAEGRAMLAGFDEIIRRLRVAEATWTQRCPPAGTR